MVTPSWQANDTQTHPFRSKKVQPASLFTSLLPHAHPPPHPKWANYPKHISHYLLAVIKLRVF